MMTINDADFLAPIPGTKFVHTIQENKRKRTSEMSTTKKTHSIKNDSELYEHSFLT